MAEPKIRFKKADGSSYPSWKKHSVGDMTVELTEYKPLSCGLPLLTSSRTGLMFQDEYRGKTSTENRDTMFSVVPRGAVTYRHMSDDNIFHFNINELVDAGLVSKEYPVFNTVNGNNTKLLVEYLNSSDQFLEFCKAQKKGGTRTRLYFKVLKGFEMLFPCFEEQQIIADFLSSIDDVITASEEEVLNLEKQKKAVMKKIFLQEVRFKRADGSDFPEWEENALSERTSNFRSGKNIEAEKIKTQGIYPVIGGNGIRGYTDTYSHEGVYAVIGRQGALCGNVNLIDGKNYLTEHAVAVRGDDRTDTVFLSLLLDHMNLRKHSGQSAQPGLAVSDIIKLTALFPCLEEQRLIADLLSNFDKTIAAAKNELELWKTLKKGLLQQMFV